MVIYHTTIPGESQKPGVFVLKSMQGLPYYQQAKKWAEAKRGQIFKRFIWNSGTAGCCRLWSGQAESVADRERGQWLQWNERSTVSLVTGWGQSEAKATSSRFPDKCCPGHWWCRETNDSSHILLQGILPTNTPIQHGFHWQYHSRVQFQFMTFATMAHLLVPSKYGEENTYWLNIMSSELFWSSSLKSRSIWTLSLGRHLSPKIWPHNLCIWGGIGATTTIAAWITHTTHFRLLRQKGSINVHKCPNNTREHSVRRVK